MGEVSQCSSLHGRYCYCELSRFGVNSIAYNGVLGDALALVSAGLYAVYITLIRKKLPNENKGEGHASMAQFLGYLGLFNLLIFLPVVLYLNFTKIEAFHKMTWSQFGLIVGKGMHHLQFFLVFVSCFSL